VINFTSAVEHRHQQ